jgi:hypothetical protein
MAGAIPHSFLCPITCDVMDRPVVATDGHSYELEAITRWLESHMASPLTNAPLHNTMLIPNVALRSAIDEWRAVQPMAIDPERLSLSEELIGEGSFGRVVAGVLATHGREQRVAVKTLPALTQREARAQFENELRAHLTAQQVSELRARWHLRRRPSVYLAVCVADVLQGADGVCRLLGTCEKGNRLCLVMKRYERSLADLIKSDPLSAATIRSISHSLCRTLAQLHRAGVVVQDIKPQNVLLDGYDSPVLADFGIASVVSCTTQIMPTQLKGTSNYMAPEAFEPPFGAKVDVWSMGCLIVEMSTGSPPWADLNMQQIMMAVTVRRRAPDVPDTVPAAEAVRQCFAFDPKERPTASALADAFRPPEDDAAGANPAELQRQHLQIDALRRANAALAAENAAQQAELAVHRQAAEAAASRLGESEALVAQLTGEIAAQRADSAAQQAAHAAQIAQMEALQAQLQCELGRRYVS